MRATWIAVGLGVSVALMGCVRETSQGKEDQLTVGKVQGEIKDL